MSLREIINALFGLRRRINALFVYSIILYGMALVAIIPTSSIGDFLAEPIATYTDIVNKYNILIACVIVSIILSLIQNTQRIFDSTGKLYWNKIVIVSMAELVIMLGGTFAALMSFLTVLVRPNIDIIVIIIILAGMMVVINIARPRILNVLHTKIKNF